MMRSQYFITIHNRYSIEINGVEIRVAALIEQALELDLVQIHACYIIGWSINISRFAGWL